MKFDKVEKLVSQFLTNKLVLNIVAFLSILNVIGYLVIGNTNNVFLFIILGVLVRYFTKNMIIVLGVPLILVNVIHLKKSREGLDNNTSTSTSTSTDNKDKIKNKKKDKPIDAKSKQGLHMTPLDDEKEGESENDSSSDDKEVDGFEAGRDKNQNSIRYSSTISDAYEDLNKILGSEGMKQLTDESKTLMEQQTKLLKSFENLTPIVKNIAPLIGQLKNMTSSLNDGKEGGLGDMMNLVKQFTGKTGNIKTQVE